MSLAWIDGRFVRRESSPAPSLTEGEGLFETILVRGKEPLFLAEHLARLLAAAAEVGLPGVPERDALDAACRALAAGGAETGHMRVLLGVSGSAVTLDRFVGYPPETYEAGVDVVLAARTGHPLGDRAGKKVLPYSPLLNAREVARNRGAFEVLFRDLDGVLLEGSASNFFVVSGGTLLTPPVTRPLLPGVTRAAALRTAERLGIPAEEADLRPEHLEGADEAFLTGSLMEVVPIRGLGGARWRPGPVAARLRRELFPR